MDTSENQLQFPVMQESLRVLSSILRENKEIACLVASTVDTLARLPEWKEGEEWIWQFALSNLFGSLVELNEGCLLSESLLGTMIGFFTSGNYPVQMVLIKPFIALLRMNNELNRLLNDHHQQAIGQVVCSLLGSHNFLSEWCCALQGYFELLRVVVDKCPLHNLQPAVQRMFVDLSDCSCVMRLID